LVQPQLTWRDLASAGALAVLSVIFLIFYLRRNPTLRHDHRGVALIAVLYLTFLLIVRLIIPSQTVLPYIFPLAAYSLTVAVLFGAEPALISTLPLAILAAYNMPNPLELILYYLLSGCFGVLTLGRARRMTAFFFAGAAVASSGAIISIVYRLPGSAPDWQGIYNVVGAATLNGIASAGLTVLLQFFLAQFLGMTTALQLMEISRPDHPLLKKLLRNAPGTYQHSLQVANLAEQASERIGADPLLTRVGALYHDIGKTQNPMFFIENQVPGSPNPHDSLDPLTSSGVILHHANDGLELARKHRLPRRIQDFILEHHGDMITRYQYVKALEAAGGDESQVDTKQYRYPGPRPGSRETAIVMLADGCEARVRAERPLDEEELHKLVKSVIQNRMSNGQLDNTNLTLRDLDAIADSFTATLRGMYHPRLEYPQLEPAAPLTAPPMAPSTVSAEVTRPVQAAPLSDSETPSLEMPKRPHGSPENP
jgi:putative nucleotidyltransferase with HDIG domain